MRFIELEQHIAVRTRVSFNNGLTFGVPVAVILFLLTVASGFFGALLFGILFGMITFGTIFFIRELTHRGVERKRKKLSISSPQIDVLYHREIGLLELNEDKLVYHSLTPGGSEKDFEIILDDNQYISVGEINKTGLLKLIHRNIELGFILTKRLPDGLPKQFIFYNVNDTLTKVEKEIKYRSAFDLEE